jgi:hypothetical protein
MIEPTSTPLRDAEVLTDAGALFNALDIGLLVLGGAALALAAVGVRRLLALVPMSREARTVVTRAAPVAGLAVALGYLGFAVRVLFRDASGRPLGELTLVSLLLGLLLVAVVIVSWESTRNFFSGVVLKAGGSVQMGDLVRIGEVHGRVMRLGHRALVIETADGAEAVLPYAEVTRGLVQRTKVIHGAALHAFNLPRPRGTALPELKRKIVDTALRCHWSSPVREPKVEVVDDGSLEVTVFALHQDYGPDIEAAVRRVVAHGVQQQAAQDRRIQPPTLQS